jgi:hypothetical protein
MLAKTQAAGHQQLYQGLHGIYTTELLQFMCTNKHSLSQSCSIASSCIEHVLASLTHVLKQTHDLFDAQVY